MSANLRSCESEEREVIFSSDSVRYLIHRLSRYFQNVYQLQKYLWRCVSGDDQQADSFSSANLHFLTPEVSFLQSVKMSLTKIIFMWLSVGGVNKYSYDIWNAGANFQCRNLIVHQPPVIYLNFFPSANYAQIVCDVIIKLSANTPPFYLHYACYGLLLAWQN